MTLYPQVRIITDCWRKPGTSRQYDWTAIYDGYDGADDAPGRRHIGYGQTEAEAINDLRENYPRPGQKAED